MGNGSGARNWTVPKAHPAPFGSRWRRRPCPRRLQRKWQDGPRCRFRYSRSDFPGATVPSYVYTLTSDGNGSFHVSGKHSAVGVIDHLVTADMNGDGLSDIHYTSGSIFDPIVLGVESRGARRLFHDDVHLPCLVPSIRK